jgi:hypothetical protein
MPVASLKLWQGMARHGPGRGSPEAERSPGCEPPTGELEFTGYAPEGEVTQRFVVHPGAYDGSEPFRG